MKGKTKTWPLFAGRLLAAVFLTLVTAQANADKPRFGDTFEFKIGGMNYKADAKFSSTREGRPEVELDLNDLDVDDKATNIWLGFNWQFADNWGLSFTYSAYDGEGVALASEDGNFGDIDYSVNATLESEFDIEYYIVSLGWDFINTGQSHFGVGFGLHIADLSTTLAATLELDVDGNPITPVELGASTADVTAPLPNFQIRGGHRFGDSFYLGGYLGYFALELDDVDGELITGTVFGEWRPGGGNFGVGLGYQFIDIEVTEETSSRTNKLDTEGTGPMLYVSVGF